MKFPRLKIPRFEYEAVFGSRKVIKDSRNPNQNHFYEMDLWTWYGENIADLIPEGYLVYGEIVGWLPGTNTPIQKNYTYDLPVGECELYVYRVATINPQGTLADLSWDGVKQFCIERGLKWAPEMARFTFGVGDESPLRTIDDVTVWVDGLMDVRYRDWHDSHDMPSTCEPPVPLSDKKTVDEGVCLRQEGIVPVLLKAKSAVFLQHETKLLDKGEADLESAA